MCSYLGERLTPCNCSDLARSGGRRGGCWRLWSLVVESAQARAWGRGSAIPDTLPLPPATRKAVAVLVASLLSPLHGHPGLALPGGVEPRAPGALRLWWGGPWGFRRCRPLLPTHSSLPPGHRQLAPLHPRPEGAGQGVDDRLWENHAPARGPDPAAQRALAGGEPGGRLPLGPEQPHRHPDGNVPGRPSRLRRPPRPPRHTLPSSPSASFLLLPFPFASSWVRAPELTLLTCTTRHFVETRWRFPRADERFSGVFPHEGLGAGVSTSLYA